MAVRKGKGASSPRQALATAIKRAANKHNVSAARAVAKDLEMSIQRIPAKLGKKR